MDWLFNSIEMTEEGKKTLYLRLKSNWTQRYINTDLIEKNSKIEVIHIYFGETFLMNSLGVMDWMAWCSQFPKAEFYLHECSYNFINLNNMIRGFLPKKSQIESFFVPCFNPETDEEKNVLLKKDQHYSLDGFFLDIPTVYDSQGVQMEPDVDVHKYFNFLKIKRTA